MILSFSRLFTLISELRCGFIQKVCLPLYCGDGDALDEGRGGVESIGVQREKVLNAKK